jgi:hypothetical protein
MLFCRSLLPLILRKMKTIILNQQTDEMENVPQLITLPQVKSQKPGMKKHF